MTEEGASTQKPFAAKTKKRKLEKSYDMAHGVTQENPVCQYWLWNRSSTHLLPVSALVLPPGYTLHSRCTAVVLWIHCSNHALSRLDLCTYHHKATQCLNNHKLEQRLNYLAITNCNEWLYNMESRLFFIRKTGRPLRWRGNTKGYGKNKHLFANACQCMQRRHEERRQCWPCMVDPNYLRRITCVPTHIWNRALWTHKVYIKDWG